MSVATELQNLNDNILDAYTAVQGKGGTVPANKNTANLDTAIASIPAGPEAYIPREIDANGVFGQPTQSFSYSLPSGATDVGNNALYAAFRGSSLTSADFSSLTTVSGLNAFFNAFTDCLSLTSADFSSLTTVSGNQSFYYAFQSSRLTSADFSSLATVSGTYAFAYAFQSSSLTSLSFPALTTVNGSQSFQCAFQYCSRLASLSFPALTASSFGSYTNQFHNMLQGCSNVTVHFPAVIQSTIESWSDVTSGFGGANTTVLFDL